jgi:outer membrane protein insertion porin family
VNHSLSISSAIVAAFSFSTLGLAPIARAGDLDLAFSAVPSAIESAALTFGDPLPLATPSTTISLPSIALPFTKLSQSVPSEASEPSTSEPSTGEEIPGSSPDGAPAAPTSAPANRSTPAEDPRVLVAEVQVQGVEGNPQANLLRDQVFNAIQTTPGEPTTRQALENDLNAIFATGYFSNVQFLPQDTPLGVRITFLVTPNPVLTAVQVAEGTRILPPTLVEDSFKPLYGTILNFKDLQDGIQAINQWYQENGYVLGQVVDAGQVSPDGVLTLTIAEGEVSKVDVRFVDENGETVEGKTKPYIITREFSLKPGDVFNRNQAESDLQRVFGLGIFEDVQLSLDPAPEDPRKVIVIANVTEGRTGSIGAGAGLSSSTGLFGSISYQQQNLRGRNYTLGTDLTLGTDALLFNVSFTNPWIKNDPYRTSYTVNAFRRRSISLVFDEGERDINLPNGDTPRVVRTGGGLSFTRPLSKNVYNPSVWTASLGLEYQRVNIQDSEGGNASRDELGNALTLSGDNADDLFVLGLGLSRDLRNNRTQPTAGSLARVGLDQSVPLGQGSILMSRLRGSYSYYIPLRLVRFSKGCKAENPSPADCPQTLAFNIQGGTVLGDLPPYEAFSLGGSNSVRGYREGEIGAGRSFLQATSEYRFPLFSFVGGALFADVGTDLGSSGGVPGDPAGIREKPGSGFGVGLGARIRSPIGAIRVDYGFNDQGDGRFHFGIGERF